MTWHVLHTKSRQEKALANDLDARGIRYFLPMISKVRYHGRRKARVDAPLFPGYLFLDGEREDAFMADRTRRVAQILDVLDQEKLDRELADIRRALEVKITLEPFPRLTAGTRVEVTAGPLRGVRGVIEKRRRRSQLLLQVDMIGQASSLEIDGSLLEPIDP